MAAIALALLIAAVLAQFNSKLHFHYPNHLDTIAAFTFENTHEIDFS